MNIVTGETVTRTLMNSFDDTFAVISPNEATIVLQKGNGKIKFLDTESWQMLPAGQASPADRDFWYRLRNFDRCSVSSDR